MQKVEMTLASLQRRFRKAVREGKPASAAARKWLRDESRANLRTRVGVYQYAYWSRIVESLEEDFERTRKALGPRRFQKLGRAYSHRQPSRFYSLGEYSAEFPKFLGKQKEAKFFPYIEDLAKWEWLEILARSAEDPVSNLGDLAKLSEDKIPGVCFQLHPSVHRLSSKFKINADFAKEKTDLIIYRAHQRIKTRELCRPEVKLLNLLQKGESIAGLQKVPEATDIIQRWTADGIISGFTLLGEANV